MIELKIIEAALQGIKFKEYNDCCERILKAIREVNIVETECRRAKAAELIQAKAKMEISLEELKNSYNELKEKHGKVDEIEKVICDQKLALAHISFDKACLKRRKH